MRFYTDTADTTDTGELKLTIWISPDCLAGITYESNIAGTPSTIVAKLEEYTNSY